MPRSPFPDEQADVQLKVTAGSPLAEVFLIDHAFALVDRSIGDLECTVEPGVYRVKAKLGDATAERLVLLGDDEVIDLSGDLQIGSPAPIEGTARTRENDMSAAETESTRALAGLGDGAQIFVMARRWTVAEESADEPSSPLVVSLHEPDGTPLAQLGPSAGPVDFGHGVTVEVNPGPYFLRRRDGSGVTIEQSVHAVKGWQAQVFVLEEAGEETEMGRTRVSVLMARDGFNPRDDQLRLVEEARTALADERKVSSELLNGALFGKLENPMLGLFGAHLMLIARDAEREAEGDRRSDWFSDELAPQAPVRFDQPRFDHVVDALRDMLGDGHPDVLALATQTTGQALDALEPVMAPPMLWRSWVLLIEASNAAPALVPVSTWRRTLKLLPLRPFFLWSPEEDVDEIGKQWKEGLSRALASAKQQPQERRGGGGPAGDLAPGGSLPVRDETRRRLSRQLLAPRAAIDEVASGGPP